MRYVSDIGVTDLFQETVHKGTPPTVQPDAANLTNYMWNSALRGASDHQQWSCKRRVHTGTRLPAGPSACGADT